MEELMRLFGVFSYGSTTENDPDSCEADAHNV